MKVGLAAVLMNCLKGGPLLISLCHFNLTTKKVTLIPFLTGPLMCLYHLLALFYQNITCHHFDGLTVQDICDFSSWIIILLHKMALN